MVAVIQGHFDPWHPRLLDKTEVQLDAILEAYAEDFPNKLKFERKSGRKDRDYIEAVSVQWSDKLIGDAQDKFKRKVSFPLPARVRRPSTPKKAAPQQPRPQRKMPGRS